MKHFYGQPIDADSQQQLIQKILSKYRHEPVTNELKKKIYDTLTEAKAEGKITIPFKVVMQTDPTGVHRDYIEVILDTKV